MSIVIRRDGEQRYVATVTPPQSAGRVVHISYLLEKLAARTRTEAVARALGLGLLQEK